MYAYLFVDLLNTMHSNFIKLLFYSIKRLSLFQLGLLDLTILLLSMLKANIVVIYLQYIFRI